MNNILENSNIKSVHFVGIGGSSMSGLAAIMKHRGYTVSGSDMKESNTLKKLEENGIKVFVGHMAENIKDQQLVVYTVAVKDDNPEIIRAKELGIKIIDRAELLGQLMKACKHSIAVSGTHGKTTTTSMITMILLKAGLDPTVHIGGELDAIGGNTRIGGDEIFVVEACEYYESFLKFKPFAAVFLNIESDHLDYFRDEQHIIDVFEKFAKLVPSEGFLVGCADNFNVKKLFDKVDGRKILYGVGAANESNNNLGKELENIIIDESNVPEWNIKNLSYNSKGHPTFVIYKNEEEIASVTLSVPGKHNVSNALAAAACCYNLGCDREAIELGLMAFGGTKKRFERKGNINGVEVIDDYAHHPSEVKATLSAAANYQKNRLWCVFQPHTYTRTKAFLEDFANAFSQADKVIVTDIYAAREKNPGDVHSKMLADRMKEIGVDVLYMKDFKEIAQYLLEKTEDGDMVITMGAGDVVKVGEMML